MEIEKFKIGQHGRNDRNVKSSVEQIKQATYVNNMENKTKINEIIDELVSSDTKVNELQGELNTLAGTVSGQQTQIEDLEDITSDLQETTEYSTTEKVIGKWINGELLYRKIVTINSLPNATSTSYPHGISNPNIVKINGIATNNTVYFPIPFYRANDTLGIEIYCTKTDIVITTGTDRTELTGYIELLYTKN